MCTLIPLCGREVEVDNVMQVDSATQFNGQSKSHVILQVAVYRLTGLTLCPLQLTSQNATNISPASALQTTRAACDCLGKLRSNDELGSSSRLSRLLSGG